MKICIVSEAADRNKCIQMLDNVYRKYGLLPNEWHVDFTTGSKMNLDHYKKGRCGYDVLIFGDLYHHSQKKCPGSSIVAQARKAVYIDSFVAGVVTEVLTPDRLVLALVQYIEKRNSCFK